MKKAKPSLAQDKNLRSLETMLKKFLSLLLPPLWCAGKLGNCPSDVNRFRFTCLFCRWRRHFYGLLVDPPFWLKYYFKSSVVIWVSKVLIVDGVEYRAPEGKVFKDTFVKSVDIDPRGKLVKIRCAIIITLDNLMMRVGYRKPFTELTEFLANYPTW